MKRVTFYDDGLPIAVGTSKVSGNRQAKNWIHVNIGEREAREYRALAECLGIPFRSFLDFAIRAAGRDSERVLNIKSWDAIKLPRKRRLEIGRRHHALAVALHYCSGPGN